MNMFLVL